MFVSLRRAQTWRLHTKLFKFGWHTSANNSRMKNSRDLILGEVVYMSTTNRTQDSWVYWLNGYDFLVLIAWLVKTENSLPLKKRSSFGWSSKQEYTRHGTMQQNSTSEQFWSCDALPIALKHGAILYNEAEVFSLSITNPNGRPMLPFDWLIHSSLILASCRVVGFVPVFCGWEINLKTKIRKKIQTDWECNIFYLR